MTINVQPLDQKCTSYLMSINYFTHLIHSTALKQTVNMICCVFIYSYFIKLLMAGMNQFITQIRNSTFPNTDSSLTAISIERLFILLGSRNAAFRRCCHFSLSFNSSHIKSSSFVTLKFVLPFSHRLVRNVRIGNKIT